MQSNVEFFKLIDITLQSVLFIMFGYKLDGGNYQLIFMLLVVWQLASAVAHFFIKSVKLFKNERLMYLLAAVTFIICYLFMTKKVTEYDFGVRGPNGISMYPVHEIILTTIGLVIAFWYLTISFREVKIFFKKINN